LSSGERNARAVGSAIRDVEEGFGMGEIDELLKRNRDYAESRRDREAADPRPALPIAIVTCMDARIEPGRALGLAEGDAHVIRNAGAAVTDDIIRSLAISQVALGTREVMLVKHTECGLRNFDDDELREKLVSATGVEPPLPLGAFRDLDEAVRLDTTRIRESPLLPCRESGQLREVD
jgi:carbonic anhydrase